MFMSAMILMRLTSAGPISTGSSSDLLAAHRRCGTAPARVFGGFDVHVGRAVAQRLRDDLVDDLDDRRVRVDDDFRNLDQVEPDLARLERFDVAVHGRQRAIRLVHAVAKQRRRSEREADLLDRQTPQQCDYFRIERIGDRDRQGAVGKEQWENVQAMRVGGVDKRGRRVLWFGVSQVDDRHVQLFAQRARDVVLGHQAQLDEAFAEPLPRGAPSESFFDRVAGHEAGVDEQLTEAGLRFSTGSVRNEHRGSGGDVLALIAAAPHGVEVPLFTHATMRARVRPRHP